jgi:light-regulated signal transduction histidine kinase (bacteriophytochrome)
VRNTPLHENRQIQSLLLFSGTRRILHLPASWSPGHICATRRWEARITTERLAAIERFVHDLTEGRSPAALPAHEDALGRVEHALGDLARRLGERQKADGSRQEELRRSNAELEEFAYVASHDLQEPLRMIASYTELFARRYSGHIDERADKYIYYVTDGARRMQRLIDDLLSISRLGRSKREFAPIDTGALVADVLRGLEAAREKSGADIALGELPMVVGDRTQIGQVFQNLIQNAIKYRSGETPRIRVNAERQGAEWVFSVADNGIGFPMEHERRIFQMFKRLHAREEYEGSGIGLALVKKIVERHRGRVWAESAPGAGSTFLFTLPAAD